MLRHRLYRARAAGDGGSTGWPAGKGGFADAVAVQAVIVQARRRELGSDRNFSGSHSEAPAGSAFSRENLGSDPNSRFSAHGSWVSPVAGQ